MAQVSGPDVLQLFKKVYGQLNDNILPETQPLQKALPFAEKQRTGESYVEGVVLTNEVGITMSASGELFELNPAVAGVVKQATVNPYVMVLPSVLPWSMASRSNGSEQAFYNATKFLVKNNLRSHARFRENVYLYGQSDALLGYVSYATATYRGASFVNGTGTLTLPDNSTVTFTNGINAASKLILLAPGQFASGFWVSMEGVKVNQVDSSGNVVASGKLVSVQNDLGYIGVDFTPVAASSLTSYRLCYDGMQNAQDSIGIQKILSTTGSLFGIPTSQYSLWKANVQNYAGSNFTLQKYNTAVANLANVSALEGELVTYLNPRSWATITNNAAGLRMLDDSYKADFETGFESISFKSQNGKSTFIAHRSVKEGDAFSLYLPCWSISGSAQVSFSIPGMPNAGQLIFPLENQAGYAFRSYSDTYIFCNAPAFNIYHYNINDEASA
jgi:hypothetical protein